MKLIIINGPNLNLLGKREPEIYGSQTFEDYFTRLQFHFKDIELSYFQSNIEGELISKIQEADAVFDGIVLKNPIRPRDIMVDERVRDFYEMKRYYS